MTFHSFGNKFIYFIYFVQNNKIILNFFKSNLYTASLILLLYIKSKMIKNLFFLVIKYQLKLTATLGVNDNIMLIILLVIVSESKVK